MVFYLIGLGLGEVKDVTVRGQKIIKKCQRVYLEAYTSILAGGKEALEAFYGREIQLADREQVEQGSEGLLEGAGDCDVALLVVGDPLAATTHTDLYLRAKQLNIPVQVLNNASIMNAVGCCGLDLYKYGETVSIPFWQDGWEPISFCAKINRNLSKNLHTLCLLDIKVKEQSLENLLRGRKIFEPPRFMSVKQAASQILEVVRRRGSAEGGGGNKGGGSENEDKWVLSEDMKCVGLARVGTPTQQIVYGSLRELAESDLGEPLHSMVICGEMSKDEEEAVTTFSRYFNGASKASERATVHIIGLGLGPDDITVKGLEALEKSSRVYLHNITSKELAGVIPSLNKQMLPLPTDLQGKALPDDCCILCPSDPTHFRPLIKLAQNCPPKTQYCPLFVHNSSIINAIGLCGLQLYSFGAVVPISRSGLSPNSQTLSPNSKTLSPFEILNENLNCGLHTLCVWASEASEREAEKASGASEGANMAKILLETIVRRKKENLETVLESESRVICAVNLGTTSQQFKLSSLGELAQEKEGAEDSSTSCTSCTSCLVIVGETHPIEDEFIEMFS